jgi:hypothetical protein
MLLALLALPAVLAGAAAQAQEAPAPAPTPSVTVRATRDPVDKSYRKMVAGMDLFEQRHALAPQASLRFQLLPRLPRTTLDGVTLRVAGDGVTLPVPVAPDHTFTLARSTQAWQEDADLIANRKTSSLTWRAQVRSPGVPPGWRRLGDLRLECLVGIKAGLVSNNAAWFAWLGELLQDPDRICNAADGNYLFFAEQPLFGVTLHHGSRSATLPFAMLYAGGTQTPESLPYCDCQVLLERSYYAPIWDRSWPDDTLLSFDGMDGDPAGSGLADGYRSRAQLRAALGPAQVIRFGSGHEVWRYSYPPAAAGATNPAEPAELVVLFGPDGVALKSRRREPACAACADRQ